MYQKKVRIYNLVLNKIKEAKRIALISHMNPDGDTISSACSLYGIINDNFSWKKIDLICKNKIVKLKIKKYVSKKLITYCYYLNNKHIFTF